PAQPPGWRSGLAAHTTRRSARTSLRRGRSCVAQGRGRRARRPRGTAGPRATHVPLDGSLADADAELEELAAEALRAPARIAVGHLSDERRTRGRGSTRRPRASAPERATACLVPAEDCRRLDEQRGVAP